MNQETHLLKQIKMYVLYSLIFLFPLFFLPFTQEFFTTGKMYLLFFGSLLLLTLSLFEFLLTKKLVWEKQPLDTVVVLFFVTSILSTVLSSPNKIQALLNPGFGVFSLFSFMVVYFYVTRDKQSTLKYTVVSISSIIASFVSLLYFFVPVKDLAFPTSLQFLKNPYFTLMGSTLEAMLFFGFTSILAVSHIFSKKSRFALVPLVTLILGLGAISVHVITLIRVKDLLILPPFQLSWFAAVETLKNPMNALFGVGVDNFSSMFTRIKDLGYNATQLWQVGSFNVAASSLLHIFTEMGIVGCVSFVLLLLQAGKMVYDSRKESGSKYDLLPFVYLVVVLAFLPPSLTVVFLLLLGLASVKHAHSESKTFDTKALLPLYAAVLVIGFMLMAGIAYFGGRTYAAEVLFKRSLDGFAQNNVKTVYDNMRQAVILNPFIERFHSNFAQTNLLIANNIAAKAQPATNNQEPTTNQLSDTDRQTISQALQAAIEEAKAVVTLNPQKAGNWEGLASIYRNIINVAQGADAWTVSAYQRAIVLDPQNPTYRVALGGVLFSLKNYDEASKLFEQAISIKPDWANSYYNLAWSAFQKEEYQKAYAAMQSTVSLLDPKKDEADYKRASADLEEFKKKLPVQEEQQATSGATTKPSQLSIPTPAPSLEPKIQLPKEASPEAK